MLLGIILLRENLQISQATFAEVGGTSSIGAGTGFACEMYSIVHPGVLKNCEDYKFLLKFI